MDDVATRDSQEASTLEDTSIPQTCPYCGSQLQARKHKNGTIEKRCVQTQPNELTNAHGMTLYVKPRK